MTERVRAANLLRIQQAAIELARVARRATGRMYASDVERARAKIPFSDIKQFVDWGQFAYQAKSEPHWRPILAKTFVFTSCVHPSLSLWYVTAAGTTEPEWDRRLRDFGQIILVQQHEVPQQPPHLTTGPSQ